MSSSQDRPSDAPPPKPSSSDWARRLQRGDPDAVLVVRERVAKILAYKRLGIGNRQREDLEQEVMAELWQAVNRSGFDFSAGFWGFVEVVTARRCIDWLRARRETAPIDDTLPDSTKGPLRQTLDRERSEVISRVLSKLDSTCREVILLRMRENLSFREIAEITGKSEGALRVQMYRCVRKARHLLKEVAPGADLRPEIGGSPESRSR